MTTVCVFKLHYILVHLTNSTDSGIVLAFVRHFCSVLLLQPHLRKCFGNIHQLGIFRQAHSPAQIQHMTSEEGESVQLPK